MSKYISKESMYGELVMYNETNVISEQLATQIVMLAVKIKDSNKFQSYEMDGMVEDAIAYCLEKLDSFNIENSAKNPFHFFSQMIYWYYLRVIDKMKKELNFKSHVDSVADYMGIAYPQYG